MSSKNLSKVSNNTNEDINNNSNINSEHAKYISEKLSDSIYDGSSFYTHKLDSTGKTGMNSFVDNGNVTTESAMNPLHTSQPLLEHVTYNYQQETVEGGENQEAPVTSYPRSVMTALGPLPLPEELKKNIPEKFVAKPIIEEREIYVSKKERKQREIEVPHVKYEHTFEKIKKQFKVSKLVPSVSQVIKEVPKEILKPVIEEKIIEVPQGVKYVEVPVEVPCLYPPKIVPKVVTQYVERIVETIKPVVQEKVIEVPQTVIKQVPKIKTVEVPYYVPRYVEKIVEVPFKPNGTEMPRLGTHSPFSLADSLPPLKPTDKLYDKNIHNNLMFPPNVDIMNSGGGIGNMGGGIGNMGGGISNMGGGISNMGGVIPNFNNPYTKNMITANNSSLFPNLNPNQTISKQGNYKYPTSNIPFNESMLNVSIPSGTSASPIYTDGINNSPFMSNTSNNPMTSNPFVNNNNNYMHKNDNLYSQIKNITNTHNLPEGLNWDYPNGISPNKSMLCNNNSNIPPIVVTCPPEIGKVTCAQKNIKPDILTKTGVYEFDGFKKTGTAQALFPPLAEHEQVPFLPSPAAAGTPDVRAISKNH